MNFAVTFKRLIPVAFLITGCSNPAPADIYCVRPGANGNGSGADWQNALPALPPSLTRGSTYYLASGNYGTHSFSDPGANGSTIQIRKATVGDHGPQNGWNDSMSENPALFGGMSFTTGDYSIDGAGGSIKTGYGIEVCDTSAATNNNANIIDIEKNVSDLTFSFLDIHRPTMDYKGTGVYAACGGDSKLTFNNCYIHDIFGVHFYFIQDSGIVLQRCTLANNKSTPDWHSESIQARATVGLTVCYSWFLNIQGTGVIVSGSGYSHQWNIYGNVFDSINVGQGIVCDNALDSITGINVYNNTILNGLGCCTGVELFNSVGVNTVYDNLWWNCVSLFMKGVTYDYNVYSSSDHGIYAFLPGPHEPQKDPSGLKTSLNINPFMDQANLDIRLRTRIQQYPGKALSAQFSSDMDSVTRGADGFWDSGALEYRSTATQISPLQKNPAVPGKLNLNAGLKTFRYSLDGRREAGAGAGPSVCLDGGVSVHFTFEKFKRLTN